LNKSIWLSASDEKVQTKAPFALHFDIAFPDSAIGKLKDQFVSISGEIK
jgi:hypothetical protein